MRREGRQHGLVRTCPVLPPNLLNPITPKHRYAAANSTATAGLFTKVSSKPTNHSKFTGKCGRPQCSECHDNPASKAKAKAKGTLKTRATDADSINRAITWRGYVDAANKIGRNVSGFSATGILDDLVGDFDAADEYEE